MTQGWHFSWGIVIRATGSGHNILTIKSFNSSEQWWGKSNDAFLILENKVGMLNSSKEKHQTKTKKSALYSLQDKLKEV